MGFWAWFWIWVSLVIGSLAVYALIGKSLFNRGMEVLHQLERITKPAQALIEAMDSKAKAIEGESDLLGSVGELEAERRAILNRKTKNRSARQRSLISALKHIDVNESRFTND
jgi:heme exporter protein D